MLAQTFEQLEKIHPQTLMGAVHLKVSDLERSLEFYSNALGMQVQNRNGNHAILGAGDSRLVHLTGNPDAVQPGRKTGLYHFALLLPSRLELARAIQRLSSSRWPLQGFADHLVSEAVYLEDPDGIGIELSRDRPRNEWRTDSAGRIAMGTNPLDLQGVMTELSRDKDGAAPMHPDSRMGHVHLRVSDLAAAVAFYRDVLGFDLTNDSFPSAAFLSAGGYHHHLGLNTWMGVGIPAPPENAVGLQHLTLQLPGREDVAALKSRLDNAVIGYSEAADGLLVRDPSHNGVLIVT